MEGKKLRQLIASAQLELNRLATKEKTQTRREKTHRKIVLGGEVAKYMGLDINQDMLVGFLMTYATTTEEQRDSYISNGARARHNEMLRKEQNNKNSVKKQTASKTSDKRKINHDTTDNDDAKKKTLTQSDIIERGNHFFEVLSKKLQENKDE
ncbi:TPA: conjugal transfer protein TraD [Klebsiella variicola subsp. variicola]